MARPRSITRREPLTCRLFVRLTETEENLLYALVKRARLRDRSSWVRGVINAQAKAAGLVR
jgi:hypothetical protein